MIGKVHGRHQLCVIHMLIISMLSKRGKIANRIAVAVVVHLLGLPLYPKVR